MTKNEKENIKLHGRKKYLDPQEINIGLE